MDANSHVSPNVTLVLINNDGVCIGREIASEKDAAMIRIGISIGSRAPDGESSIRTFILPKEFDDMKRYVLDRIHTKAFKNLLNVGGVRLFKCYDSTFDTVSDEADEDK